MLQGLWVSRSLHSTECLCEEDASFLSLYSLMTGNHVTHPNLDILANRMRPVINLLSHFATKRKQPTTLLVATTGDTGPAAVRAVGDAANPLLTIIVHYPQGQISEFQR